MDSAHPLPLEGARELVLTQNTPFRTMRRNADKAELEDIANVRASKRVKTRHIRSDFEIVPQPVVSPGEGESKKTGEEGSRKVVKTIAMDSCDCTLDCSLLTDNLHSSAYLFGC